jgi:hypothetical protein
VKILDVMILCVAFVALFSVFMVVWLEVRKHREAARRPEVGKIFGTDFLNETKNPVIGKRVKWWISEKGVQFGHVVGCSFPKNYLGPPCSFLTLVSHEKKSGPDSLEVLDSLVVICDLCGYGLHSRCACGWG